MALWPGELGWFYGALAGKVVMAAFADLHRAGSGRGGRAAGGKLGGLVGGLRLPRSSLGGARFSERSERRGAGLLCVPGRVCHVAGAPRRGAAYLLPGLLGGRCSGVQVSGAGVCRSAAGGLVLRGTDFQSVPLYIVKDGRIANPSHGRAGPFLAGALAGGGAWYAKNAALAGNPVYPLAYGVFGGKSRTPEKNAQWQQGPPGAARQRRPALLAQADWPPPWPASPAATIWPARSLVPLLLAAALAALPIRNPQSAIRNLQSWRLLLLLILAVWWLFSHRIDRFLLPAWPFAALLAAAAAAALDDAWWRRSVLAFCAGWPGLLPLVGQFDARGR